MVNDNPFWTEKYRPNKVEDVILPQAMKDKFLALAEKGDMPNLILSGPPGIGKTTIARAILESMGHDVYVINGSLSGNIDTLRNEIMDFASGVSFSGNRKTVLIDEADYLNPQSFQPALRNFMEEFSRVCGFVLTCNFPTRLIEPLRSRCHHVEFKFSPEELKEMKAQFFVRICSILDTEEVSYDPKVVGSLVQKYAPDWRKVLNELQGYSAAGKVDTGILGYGGDREIAELIRLMKEKNFTDSRKWIAEKTPDPVTFFRAFYDHGAAYFTDDSIPQLVLTIGEYQYKSSHVADQEINLAAFVVHVMATARFRS